MKDADAVLSEYTPKLIAPEIWANIRPFVQEGVRAAQPPSAWTALNYIKAVAAFVAWAVEQSMSLDRNKIFAPSVIEHYNAKVLARRPDQYRAHRLAILRIVGRAWTTTAPWQPKNAAYARSLSSEPYTPAEIARYWEIADQQKTPRRTRVAKALIAVGLGAGLMPREHLEITGRSIRDDRGVLVIDVPGSHARTVPVRREWADTVAELAAAHPDDSPCGVRNADAQSPLSKAVALIEVPPGVGRPIAARLRLTWMTAVLTTEPPLRISEFQRIAGLKSLKHLESLAPTIPVRDNEMTFDAAAGPGSG